jgi:hypothetical protein
MTILSCYGTVPLIIASADCPYPIAALFNVDN